MGGSAPGSGVPLTGGKGGEMPSVGRKARIASIPVRVGGGIGGGGVAGSRTFCCGAAGAAFGAAVRAPEVCGAAIASWVDLGAAAAVLLSDGAFAALGALSLCAAFATLSPGEPCVGPVAALPLDEPCGAAGMAWVWAGA